MERKIILASHGKFASGILSSLELICGVNKNILVLDCYLTQEFDLAQSVESLLKATSDCERIVVTDLFGGSVNNEFLKYIEQPNFYLVAGLNLSFLIELTTLLAIEDEIPQMIQQALAVSKETIQFCNETFQNEPAEEEF